jgi:hypothetical protein
MKKKYTQKLQKALAALVIILMITMGVGLTIWTFSGEKDAYAGYSQEEINGLKEANQHMLEMKDSR